MKIRTTVTADGNLARVLAAYEKAGIDPTDVLVAELRRLKKTSRAGREKIFAEGGCNIGSKRNVR